MSSQTGFWFPSMKISEIARALEEWGLRVSEDQIHKPTGEVVQAIYIVFLQQVTGINPESLEEPVNRAISVIEEHPVCLSLFLHRFAWLNIPTGALFDKFEPQLRVASCVSPKLLAYNLIDL